MKTTQYFSLFFFLVVFSSLAFGQYETVDYNSKMGYFNNGQPLPAESNLIISGTISKQINRVSVQLYRPGSNKFPLAGAMWKRGDGPEVTSFKIPLNYPLRGSSKYDFVFTTYRKINALEKRSLTETFNQNIHIYLQQVSLGQEPSIQLSSSANSILKDLNKILVEGLYYYQSKNGQTFPGFSDIVKAGLVKLRKEPGSLVPTLQAIRNEIDQYFQPDWFILMEQERVSSYPTEKGTGTLALNVGYGGVYLDGGLEDLSYATSPYVGISFPLGNRFFSGSFISNTSLSMGVFTQNFSDSDSTSISGPIFGRPYYVGLGYSFFRFVRLNVGATALEKVGSSNIGDGSASLKLGAIKVAPFVGLSAEINLWVGLGGKR